MYAVVQRALSHLLKPTAALLVPLAVVVACGVPNSNDNIDPVNDQKLPYAAANREACEHGVDEIAAGNVLDPPPAPIDLVNSAADPSLPTKAESACPQGMILVEGQFCPNVEQTCLEWKDDPAKFQFARCARYAEPSTCKGERVSLRFCVDKYEAGDDSGVPIGNVSWTTATERCTEQGKRLCREHEWLFACEGEEMRPYPYGYARNPSICNFEITEGLATKTGDLADHRQPVTANPDCVSPFGVVNMVGNIDEWVELDHAYYSAVNGGRKMMSGLKGGWWGPLRNRCRPTTVDHDEYFHELQTGYRCCADAT